MDNPKEKQPKKELTDGHKVKTAFNDIRLYLSLVLVAQCYTLFRSVGEIFEKLEDGSGQIR